jgi:hypothetical protein
VQCQPGATSGGPAWGYSETFRDVPSSETLTLEVWALQQHGMGRRDSFLGCAEVPLQQTLPAGGGGSAAAPRARHPRRGGGGADGGGGGGGSGSGTPAAPAEQAPDPWEPRWVELTRRDGAQHVTGRVLVAFVWQFTAEGLLAREVAALESILGEKVELLARLRALPPERSLLLMQGRGGGTEAGPGLTAGGAAAGAGELEEGGGLALAAAAAGDGRSDASDGGEEDEEEGEEEEEEGAGAAGGGGGGSGGALLSTLDRGVLDLGQAHHVNLEVTVLELRNLQRPRRLLDGGGAGAAAAAAAGEGRAGGAGRGQPRPLVRVSCGGGAAQEVAAHEPGASSELPRSPLRFQGVPLGAALQLQVLDRQGLLGPRPLAQASLPCAALRGTDPVYMWLPLEAAEGPGLLSRLQRSLSRRRAGAGAGGAPAAEQALALVRFRILKPQLRGASVSLQAQLAGCSVAAKTDAGEELANLTVSGVQLAGLVSTGEQQLSAAVRAVQLDNQLLEARHPVVLSNSSNMMLLRAAEVSAAVAAALQQQQALPQPEAAAGAPAPGAAGEAGAAAGVPGLPLVQLSLVRSFAGSGTMEQRRRGGQQQPQQSQILAFKRIELLLAPLDLEADQAFLEALYLFHTTLPLDDLVQGPGWQAAVARLQGGRAADDGPAAPGGARALPPPHQAAGGQLQALAAGGGPQGQEALAWLWGREEREMSEMRGQSSTWFFFEELNISALNVCATVNLSSNLLAGGGAGQRAAGQTAGGGAATAGRSSQALYQRQLQRGLLKRLVGQLPLVDVSNAAIELRGLRFSSQLLNMVGLCNHVYNHYYTVSRSQLVKVLDGALNATPLNIITSPLWAVTSIAGVSASAVKQRSARQLVPQAGCAAAAPAPAPGPPCMLQCRRRLCCAGTHRGSARARPLPLPPPSPRNHTTPHRTAPHTTPPSPRLGPHPPPGTCCSRPPGR